jgi:hypothetical protein
MAKVKSNPLNAVEVERNEISRVLDRISYRVELAAKMTMTKKCLGNFRMRCVGINERLLKQLFALDQVISAGNVEIRTARKELVRKIQDMMSNTDQLIVTLDKMIDTVKVDKEEPDSNSCASIAQTNSESDDHNDGCITSDSSVEVGTGMETGIQTLSPIEMEIGTGMEIGTETLSPIEDAEIDSDGTSASEQTESTDDEMTEVVHHEPIFHHLPLADMVQRRRNEEQLLFQQLAKEKAIRQKAAVQAHLRHQSQQQRYARFMEQRRRDYHRALLARQEQERQQRRLRNQRIRSVQPCWPFSVLSV